MRKEARQAEAAEKKCCGREIYEWVQALVFSVLTVVLLFTFVIRLIGVDGHSMMPTLQDGDRLLVLNSALCGGYRRGDIVVLRKESFLPEPIVKRVIATEGQVVDIDFFSGAVLWMGSSFMRIMSTSRHFWRKGWNFPSQCRKAASLLWGITATPVMTAGTSAWVLWMPAM